MKIRKNFEDNDNREDKFPVYKYFSILFKDIKCAFDKILCKNHSS